MLGMVMYILFPYNIHGYCLVLADVVYAKKDTFQRIHMYSDVYTGKIHKDMS